MSNKLFKLLGIITTTRCTLNCKLCAVGIPKFKSANIVYDTSLGQLTQSLDVVFNIYDYVSRIDISGGEPLLWGEQNLIGLLLYLDKRLHQVGEIRILTNGTILPSTALMETIIKLDINVSFVLDNYGLLSTNSEGLKNLLSRYKIYCRDTKYFGDKQWHSGWIDILGDLSFRNYSKEQLLEIHNTCHVHSACVSLFNGKLWKCQISPLCEIINGTTDEVCSLDLLVPSTSIDDKRRILLNWENVIPLACQYCNGMDSANAKRYPAAEQV